MKESIKPLAGQLNTHTQQSDEQYLDAAYRIDSEQEQFSHGFPESLTDQEVQNLLQPKRFELGSEFYGSNLPAYKPRAKEPVAISCNHGNFGYCLSCDVEKTFVNAEIEPSSSTGYQSGKFSREEYDLQQAERIRCLENHKKANQYKTKRQLDKKRSVLVEQLRKAAITGLDYAAQAEALEAYDKSRGYKSRNPRKPFYTDKTQKKKLEYKEPDPWYAELSVYDQDVVVKTRLVDHMKIKARGKRGKIKALSPAARKRFKLHLRNIREGSLNLFVTLTYGADYPVDGAIVKQHLKSMRQWLIKQGVKQGVWFLEFQKRGAPHFHFFVQGNHTLTSAKVAKAWARRLKKYLPDSDARDKLIAVHQGNVKNGRPCVEFVRKPHALSYYGTKYATKSHQKEVPDNYQNVGRFWGYWGEAKPNVQTIIGRGYESVMRLRYLLKDWRYRWKMQKEGCITEDDIKDRKSGTLWGGRSVLDELLEVSEWCPF